MWSEALPEVALLLCGCYETEMRPSRNILRDACVSFGSFGRPLLLNPPSPLRGCTRRMALTPSLPRPSLNCENAGMAHNAPAASRAMGIGYVIVARVRLYSTPVD